MALNTSASYATALLIPSGGVRVTSLASCNTIDTDALGNFVCGTDQTGGAGTVTSVGAYQGLQTNTSNPFSTSGNIGLNLTGISSCTNSTSNKIYWNGSYLACGTDQTGGVGGLTGSGSTNYISKWTGATSLGNSQIYDNGANVGIGTASPASKLTIGSGASYDSIEVKKGAVYIKDSGYSGSTLQLLARDIRTSNNEDLYLNWDNASGNVVIGGDTEKKVLYLAGPSGGAGVGSAVDAPDYWIRSVGRWASAPPAISGDITCPQSKTTGTYPNGTNRSCSLPGTWDLCFLTKVNAQDPSGSTDDVNSFSCTITGSGSSWTLTSNQYGNNVDCAAKCINW